MRPRIKVCGVTDPGFAAEAARRGVDYLGAIFAAGSPRRVDGATARQIAAAARAARPESPPRVVGVFTAGSAAEIAATAAAASLDSIQLHGEFGDDVVAELKGAGYEVWRLYGSAERRSPVDFEDAVLLDGRDGGKTGGTGRLADWALVGELKRRGFCVVLAGGLSAENCAAAAETGADVLDFNSSLEIEPGVKSLQKLDELFDRLAPSMKSRDF